MDPQSLGALFGLASALSWGAGDFCGGLATQRSSALGVVLIAEVAGISALGALALILAEPLAAWPDLAWSGMAGLVGTLGLLAFYRALAGGRMGVAAPIAGVISAAVPALWGSLLEGMPAAARLAGFGLALVAVWLVSSGQNGHGLRARELALPVAAGVAFGAYLILMDRASAESVLWPLIASRTASIALLLAVAVAGRRGRPGLRRQAPLAALTGLLDTGGNALYALAAQVGRLDVAAVLASLYPAVTVLLARTTLKEPVGRRQALGVVVALAAVVLIAG